VPYTLLGVAGAALAGAVVSWVWIGSIDNDEHFKDYRARVGANPGASDVCDEAEKGLPYASVDNPEYAHFSDVQSMCSTGQTLEVLQWVFLGTALAAGGVGTYFLIVHLNEKKDQSAADEAPLDEPESAELAAFLKVQPRVGLHSASLTATLNF
jgi:hypothetical protein